MINNITKVKVTIITPLYNCEKYLEETLRSIQNQKYQFWESILIDDCSQDSSLMIAEKFAKEDNRFRIIKFHENVGAAQARNAGIEDSSGRFIAFLDSDDIWEVDKLQKQIDYMTANNVCLSFSDYKVINENGNIISEVSVPDIVDYESLLNHCSIACLTVIYDVSILGKVFMPDIRKRQDYALWLKITKNGVIGCKTPGSLAKYRIRKGSISYSKLSTIKYTWKVYRDIERLNHVKALKCIISHLLNASLKHLKNKI